MKKHSTERRKRAIREAIGWLIIGVVVLYLAHMAGYLTAEPVGAKPRPTACRPGIDYCGDRLATSVVRPGQRNVPRRETPTPRRARP